MLLLIALSVMQGDCGWKHSGVDLCSWGYSAVIKCWHNKLPPQLSSFHLSLFLSLQSPTLCVTLALSQLIQSLFTPDSGFQRTPVCICKVQSCRKMSPAKDKQYMWTCLCRCFNICIFMLQFEQGRRWWGDFAVIKQCRWFTAAF